MRQANGERKKNQPKRNGRKDADSDKRLYIAYMNIEATTRRKGEVRIRKRRSSENLEEEE